MVQRVGPGQGDNYFKGSAGGATTGTGRVGYNAKTQTFEPLKGGESKKIEKMAKVEELVSKVKVPTDSTSTTFLKKVAPQWTSKGEEIKTGTEGVGDFFSGNAARYGNFVKSVSKAQDSI